jgi:peroxiredoxin Q/BCP
VRLPGRAAGAGRGGLGRFCGRPQLARGFANEYNLPFPLLSDPDNAVAKEYGAYGERYSASAGKTVEGVLRSTFIIDPEGKVAGAMYSVNHDQHAGQVGERLRELQGV